MKLYSGHICNQFWERSKLIEEEDITDAAHKAYYKDLRAHNALCTEHEHLAKVLNKVDEEQLAEFLSL